jgi:hypothetical protein
VSIGARIAAGEQARDFILAGHARVTLVSQRTGMCFTYSVRVHDTDTGIWFVSVLTGPGNTDDYAFLGTVFAQAWGHPARYVPGRKSKVDRAAPSARAFAWAWGFVSRGTEPPECEVWHEGRCGRCGRVLTVPESIASGIGPKCEGRRNEKAA